MSKKSSVFLNLSWKQKLSIIIAITLIGLVIVAGSAFISLNSVNSSFEKQSTAVEYKQNSQALTISLLRLKSLASNLNTQKTTSFITNLESLEKLALKMNQQAKALDNDELVSFSIKLENLIAEYTRLRQNWLDNGQVLGFNSEEGNLANLSNAMAELKEVSFSMIDDTVSNLVFSQGKYIVSKDLNSETDIEGYISELELVVIDMDWQENIVGKVIVDYRQAFEAVRGLITKDAEITSALTIISHDLTLLVEQQDNFLEEIIIKQVAQEANDTRKAAITVISVVAIIVGLIIFVSLGRFSKQLNSQLQHIHVFLKEISAGNFTKSLPINTNEKDEFTQLRLASNHMVNGISNVISEVVSGNKSLLNIRGQLEKAVEQLGKTSEHVEQKTQQSTLAT